MKLFYMLAKEAQADVDHIVPINHPLVCGLHCEDNLQIVTVDYNKFKTNLFWPEMPEYTYEDYSSAYFKSRNF